MRFVDFQAELASRLKIDIDANEVVIQRKINDAYKEIARAYDWEHLRRTGELTTVPNYTTGTVTVTNGSYVVTGSGTAWTSTMEGRFFKPQGSGNWYRISKVQSATQLTLLSPYLDSTLSGQTYSIWKRFYYIYSEVHRIIELGTWIRNGVLVDKSSTYLGDNELDPSVSGEPESFSLYGADPFERTYSDGTVTTTQNSNLLTGVGTSFLGNAEPGDIVTIGGDSFRVKRVESDTTIRLTNSVINAVSASTYSIAKDNPIGIQLYFAANASYLFPFTYTKRVYDMLNDSDRPELPEDFDIAILDGAEASRYRELNDARWQPKLQEYVLRVKDLMSQRLLSRPRARVMAPKIYTRGGYING